MIPIKELDASCEQQTAGGVSVFGHGRYDSMCYPQYGNGVRLEGSTLILSSGI